MNLCNKQDKFNMQKHIHTRMINAVGYKIVNTV